MNDFKNAVTDSAATYFGKGFEFCKRQLLHHHLNLDVDLAGMEMDTDLAEEEERLRSARKGRRMKAKSSLLLDLVIYFFFTIFI